MNATWSRILIGLAMAVCLLGIGTLEVLGGRLRVDSPFTMAAPPSGIGAEPSADLPADVSVPEASVDGAQLTASIQAGRPTVLTVDENARRLLALNATGRVLVTDVSSGAQVVTEDRKATALALLKPGDVIRVEPANGRVQRIVVLRHAWGEMASPAQ